MVSAENGLARAQPLDLPGGTGEPSNEAWRRQPAGTVCVRRLNLPESDEEARRSAAPQQPGYCADELCSCLKHQCLPPRRIIPFVANTTYRQEYVAKLAPQEVLRASLAVFGPDGVPNGIDPAVWKDYIAKHGVPPPHQIPAWLYYKKVQDTRDFSTESRSQFTPKDVRADHYGGLYGPDGVPHGINPADWKEYIAKFGTPPPGTIPPSLFYRKTPETRDFTTNYRKNYVAHAISICPVSRLPPYPTPNWPRAHTFWDPVAKQWY